MDTYSNQGHIIKGTVYYYYTSAADYFNAHLPLPSFLFHHHHPNIIRREPQGSLATFTTITTTPAFQQESHI